MSGKSHRSNLGCAIASFVCIGCATNAESATACGQHDAIVAALADKYHESRQILGVINDQHVMEIFSSAAGTWTILMTDTTGISCIAASGDTWQVDPRQIAGLDS